MGRLKDTLIGLEQGDLSGEAREIVRRLEQLRRDVNRAGAGLVTRLQLSGAIGEVREAMRQLEAHEQEYRLQREQRENEARCEI